MASQPFRKVLAEWQSGYAAACKAVDLGSIPGSASILFRYRKNKDSERIGAYAKTHPASVLAAKR